MQPCSGFGVAVFPGAAADGAAGALGADPPPLSGGEPGADLGGGAECGGGAADFLLQGELDDAGGEEEEAGPVVVVGVGVVERQGDACGGAGGDGGDGGFGGDVDVGEGVDDGGVPAAVGNVADDDADGAVDGVEGVGAVVGPVAAAGAGAEGARAGAGEGVGEGPLVLGERALRAAHGDGFGAGGERGEYARRVRDLQPVGSGEHLCCERDGGRLVGHEPFVDGQHRHGSRPLQVDLDRDRGG